MPVSIEGLELQDGQVLRDGNLTVSVHETDWDIGGNKGTYNGSTGNAVTDDDTNYVYLNDSGVLQINTTGFPGSATPHARLATVIAVGGVITNVVDKRANIQGTGGGAALSDTAPVNVTKAPASAGTADEASRQDHKHDVSTAAPTTIGTSNSEGSATSLARSDHVHNHGALAGGDRHAVATTSVNGFMSSADKTKLDDLYTEQYDGESDGNSTTTATTPQTKLNVTETLAGGDYKITWYAEVQSNTNLTCVRVRVTLDPGTAGEEDLAFNDLLVYNPTGISTEGVASGFAIRTLTSGSHTFRISYETTDGTYTVLIRRARLHIERIG